VGPLDGAERLAFTILLRPRPGSPELYPAGHWQNTLPPARGCLSAEEFGATYRATEEDLRAVAEFAELANLEVVEADAARRRVVVEGTAAHVNHAFGITLSSYRVPLQAVPRPLPGSQPGAQPHRPGHQVHRGFDGPVQVPEALAEVITAVIGLDNRRLGCPAAPVAGKL
jgi:kumamolisin